MTAPTRVSSAELMERFDKLEHLLNLRYRPAPFLIYKPNDREPTKGVAMKVEYRAHPKFSDHGYLIPQPAKERGGLFMDLSQQSGRDSNDNPTFGWDRDQHDLITIKFGLPDLMAMLYANTRIRVTGKTLPESLRPSRKADGKWVPEQTGLILGLTHKFDDSTTFIEWSFSERGSLIFASKSKELRRTVSLTLQEEIGFVAYLRRALDVFLETGIR